MKYISIRGLIWFLFGILLVVIFSVAYASENHNETTTVNNHYVINKHNSGEDIAKGFVIGIVATCGAVSLWTRAKHNRWTWCGEPPKDEPFPNLGPAIKND